MNSVFSFLRNGAVRRSVTRYIKESKVLRYLRLLQPEPRLRSRAPGTLPGFLVIGAQRSGSTFLHDQLRAHTNAQGSPLQKELHFFDNKYYRSLEWYAKFFDAVGEAPGSAINFETSPYYLYHPAVPARIEQSLPDVKAVAVLRNPVDRAISQYKWIRQVGLETREAAEAFRYDAERLDLEHDPAYLASFEHPLHFDYDHMHLGYLRRSLYHVQLQRWLTRFDSSHIRIVSSAMLFEQTQRVLQELADFLGLRLREEGEAQSVNQNSSRPSISVSPAARDIAQRHLRHVGEEVEAVADASMIIGGELGWT